MWSRMRLDICWRDLAFALFRCLFRQNRTRLQADVESGWTSDRHALACLSVRSGLDSLLTVLDFPVGSEIIVSAVTIADVPRIIEQHDLIPVPVDLDQTTGLPTPSVVEGAVTPRTRGVLIAQLFGHWSSLAPMAEIARRHGLLLIEDCAQAFAGRDFEGTPEADVSMFSFGTIKTSTALGGGVLLVRDGGLHERLRVQQETLPLQSIRTHLLRIVKCALLKGLSGRLLYGCFVRGCALAGGDHDLLLAGSVRGFPGDELFERIRRRPCTPLLSLLRHRLTGFDDGRLARRAELGSQLSDLLDVRVECPGLRAERRTFWVFPVVLRIEPERLIAALRGINIDVAQGHSLVVVKPSDDRDVGGLFNARQLLLWGMFLPSYVEMKSSVLEGMAESVNVLIREGIEGPA